MRRTRILITLMCLAATVALTRAPARADSAQDNYTAYSAKCHGPKDVATDLPQGHSRPSRRTTQTALRCRRSRTIRCSR